MRDRQVGVSLSSDELKEIKKLAFEADKSMSAYIRSLILEKIKKTKRRKNNGNNMS